MGNDPLAIVYDGENIWVANGDDDTLTKFRTDGSRSRVFPSGGGQPVALAFDGESVWVVNEATDNVVKYNVDDEEIRDTISVGNSPSEQSQRQQ